MQIILTKAEWIIAAQVGCLRFINSRSDGRKPAFGASLEDNLWRRDIEGACGELAAAKAINRYWSASVNVFRVADIAPNIQVRTRSRDHYDLPVRPEDDLNWIAVLVTGASPVFEVRGWIRCCDAKRDEWWKAYGGRPGAWFVPQSALLPLDQLPQDAAANVVELANRRST